LHFAQGLFFHRQLMALKKRFDGLEQPPPIDPLRQWGIKPTGF
jgi:hypothetical protein